MIRRSIIRATRPSARARSRSRAGVARAPCSRDSTAVRAVPQPEPGALWRCRTPSRDGKAGGRVDGLVALLMPSRTEAAWRRASRPPTRSTSTTTAIGGIFIYLIFFRDPARDRARAAAAGLLRAAPARVMAARARARAGRIPHDLHRGRTDHLGARRRRRAGAHARGLGLEQARRLRGELRGGRVRRADRRGAHCTAAPA